MHGQVVKWADSLKWFWGYGDLNLGGAFYFKF